MRNDEQTLTFRPRLLVAGLSILASLVISNPGFAMGKSPGASSHGCGASVTRDASDAVILQQLGVTRGEERESFDHHSGSDSLSSYCTQSPSPALMRQPCTGEGWLPVRGYQQYALIVSLPYRYTLGCIRGRYRVDVTIDLRFPEWSSERPTLPVPIQYCEDRRSFGARRSSDGMACHLSLKPEATRKYQDWILEKAGEVWTQSSTFGAQYVFRRPEPNETANFSIPVHPGHSRGPYLHEYGSTWTPRSVAHEVGHMMGLNDEYSEVSGCSNQDSLMCNSFSGSVRPFQEYLILRRWHCGAQASHGRYAPLPDFTSPL